MRESIQRDLDANARLLGELAGPLSFQIEQAVRTIWEAFRRGRKLLILGNGGSAADAQHMAAELVGRFEQEREALPALALTVDTSVLTALGNDLGFGSIFERQLEALTQEGDVVMAISTSGRSENLVRGLKVAGARGARTLALLGRDGGKVKDLVDLAIVVPADRTPQIQVAHLAIEHVLCREIEKLVLNRL